MGTRLNFSKHRTDVKNRLECHVSPDDSRGQMTGPGRRLNR